MAPNFERYALCRSSPIGEECFFDSGSRNVAISRYHHFPKTNDLIEGKPSNLAAFLSRYVAIGFR